MVAIVCRGPWLTIAVAFISMVSLCSSEAQLGQNPFSFFQGKTGPAPAGGSVLTSATNLFGFNVPGPSASGVGVLGDFMGMLTPQNLMKQFTELPNTILKGKEAGECLLRGFTMLLQKGIFFATHDQKLKSPFNLLPMDQMKKMLNFNISAGDTGDTIEGIISVIEYVLADSPHRAHPFYLKRDAAGLDPYAVAGDIIAVSVSIAGVAASHGEGSPALLLWILLQKVLGLQIKHQVGYVYGDAVMTAGPSISNIMAVQMALAVKYPSALIKGILSLSFEIPGASILISEGNHDFFKLFGLFPGLPEGMLVRVRMDSKGRMDPVDLEQKILDAKAEKLNPFMVIAVAGSKTLGSIDNIDKIGTICEKYDLWLHIDGTHAAPVLFSPTHKSRLKGLERSNSMTWSATSMLGVPAPSSYLVTKMENPLRAIWKAESAFEFVATVGATVASNLFQAPKFTDAAKTWLMWLVKGNRGLAQHVDYSYKLSRTFVVKMKKYKNFRLITKQMDTPVVSFNWIPDKWLKEKVTNETQAQYTDKLSRFTEQLQTRILFEGLIYLSTTRLRPHLPKYFIASLTNSIVTNPDLDYLLAKIDCQGRLLAEGRLGLCLNATLSRALAPLKSPISDYFPYVNAAMPDMHLSFFTGLFQLFLKKGFKLITSILTGNLQGVMDVTNLPGELADLALSEGGLKQNDFWQYLDHLFEFGLRGMNMTIGAQKFLQGFGCANVLGGLTSAVMGQIKGNYQTSPVFTMVAEELLGMIRQLVGYKKGDGVVLPPDGTLAAMYTITIAKHAYLKRMKKEKKSEGEGEGEEKKLVFYISEEAFLAWKKGAAGAGLGLENAVYIKTDQKSGKMDVTHLKSEIQKTLESDDSAPFLVVGTVGTQVLGAIDPLKKIAAVAKEFKLWFHVDAQLSGGMILSKRQRSRLKGLPLSDSFSFNPNRFYEDGIDLTLLVTRHSAAIKKSFDKPSEKKKKNEKKKKKNEMVIDEDSGDVVTGGTGADEFTFWIVLKAQGLGRAGRDVDELLDATQKAVAAIKKVDPKGKKFELIIPAYETTTICFNFIHKKWKNRDANETKAAVADAQAQIVTILKEKKVWDVSLAKSLLYEDGQFAFLKLDVTKYDKGEIVDIVTKVAEAGAQLKRGIKVTKNRKSAFSMTTKIKTEWNWVA